MKIEIIEGRYKIADFPVTIVSTTARGEYPIRGFVHTKDDDISKCWQSLDDLVTIEEEITIGRTE